MKTLGDHTIIYDDECPLCSQYTKAFVKSGMLDGNGRQAFTSVVNQHPEIDWNRARNEISMINKTNNEVLYGVDSLMAILAHNLPWLRPLFNFPPFYWLSKKLYFFISYNRKVIAPGAVFEGKNTCTPDMHYGYRWAYVLFTWVFTSFILARYALLAVPLVPASDWVREFIVCGGQILFQGIIVGLINKDRWIHYLGNVMTISFAGALALLPALVISTWITSPWFFLGYLAMVVALMFIEHIRRVRILELPWTVSASWVLYRFIVLGIILYFL